MEEGCGAAPDVRGREGCAGPRGVPGGGGGSGPFCAICPYKGRARGRPAFLRGGAAPVVVGEGGGGWGGRRLRYRPHGWGPPRTALPRTAPRSAAKPKPRGAGK